MISHRSRLSNAWKRCSDKGYKHSAAEDLSSAAFLLCNVIDSVKNCAYTIIILTYHDIIYISSIDIATDF